ncbi:2-dehydropantoate 2-reductase [Mycobacteroides chelonae]|uniref:2-dehydropantoate 2-reductase n=1 Tax=Mycobacteroides chelonae TaxID=1774 RepID=UPI0009926F06|nr:2-dehydropantoate 2-reductase [Mycobacteroides chelonae]
MRIAVAGAGSIGCYVGGRLQAAGHDLVYIGRAALGESIAERGLALSDYLGWSATIPGDKCVFSEDIDAVRAADVVLVTVKSAATAEMAASLADRLRPGAVVVSLQNGIRNPTEISRYVTQHRVITGMVGFNVAQVGPAHFHQGTQGKLSISTGAESLAQALTGSGLPTAVYEDMSAVQWGKLVVNLNNAVNALSGLPLKAELGQRDYRLVLAAAHREALGLLRRGNQPVVSPLAAPLAFMPWVLRMPDAVFARLARQMVEIDPQARSSMLDDLTRGRPTEIDYINGEVVELAKKLGVSAPVNATLVSLIHQATASGEKWSGSELRREIDDRTAAHVMTIRGK